MDKPNSFILASYNIRNLWDKDENCWTNRLPMVRQIIAANELDIFGVQEAMHSQIIELTENTGYTSIGGGRDDFRSAGEHSAIIYRREKFELLNSGTFGLSETPSVPGAKSWDAAYPRIASWGLFQLKSDGRRFLYYNTHLDNKSELARVNGIKMIVKHAKNNGQELPMVLTGDFNAQPDSDTYRIASALLCDARFSTLSAPQGSEATFHGFNGEAANCIDYIFVSRDIKVCSFKVDDTRIGGRFPSDHDPVITELELQ